jgi:hypothetical protein
LLGDNLPPRSPETGGSDTTDPAGLERSTSLAAGVPRSLRRQTAANFWALWHHQIGTIPPFPRWRWFCTGEMRDKVGRRAGSGRGGDCLRGVGRCPDGPEEGVAYPVT